MTKKLTMSDIAKMAGVGKSTVSRYFNDGYVKEETREKIKKVIEDHNYEPDPLAQIMKAKQSKMIGIITATLDSKTSSRVMMSLDKYVRDEGYMPLIINTSHNELREIKSIESLWKLKVDGIVLLATHITMAHYKMVSKLDIPFIFVGQNFDEGVSVVYDDYNAGKDVGKCIASKGHKDIIYLGVGQKDEAVGVIRKKGVLEGLKENGVDYVYCVETDFSFEHSREKISQILDKRQPSAIICATDNIALACYKEIRERGLEMPEDISLIGFGGYEVSSLVTPSITSIRFNNEEAGCIVGKTIIDMINGEDVPQKQVISYTLREGGSVKNMN